MASLYTHLPAPQVYLVVIVVAVVGDLCGSVAAEGRDQVSGRLIIRSGESLKGFNCGRMGKEVDTIYASC
jgi:hypothetical protein